MTAEEVRELEDAEKRLAELKARHGLPTLAKSSVPEYASTGKQAVPLNQPPPPPPPKTAEERLADLEQRMKDQESFKAGLRTELWKEWQVVQDQIRSEVAKLRKAGQPDEDSIIRSQLPSNS